MKVLIIEDEEELLDSIKSYLKSLNFVCEFVKKKQKCRISCFFLWAIVSC